MIKVAVVDDHCLIRSGLAMALATQPDMEMVGEYDNANTAIANIGKAAPDVLTLDINMPGINGIDAIQRIKAESPRTAIIIFTMHEPPNYAVNAHRAGAMAYITKGSSTHELLQAIRTVAEGRKYVTPEVAEVLASALDPVKCSGEQLSPREMDFLGLYCDGLSGNEIAEKLFISPKTVSSHKKHIMEKLGLRSDVELVSYAIKAGIKKI